MADATVDLEGTNLFSLGANFNTQSSSTNEPKTEVTALGATGDVACKTTIGDITEYSQSATYCGSDLVGDLGTFLTQFGTVQNSKIVTGLTITMNAGQYTQVEVTGHNHANNAHVAGLSVGYADMSDILPHEVGEPFAAFDGFGVPDFGVTLGDNATPASATVTLSMNHIDVDDEEGNHFVGKNITPSATLAMTFEGIPTSDTKSELETDFDALTGDLMDAHVTAIDKGDGNSEFDTFGFTAQAYGTLATA